MIASIILRCFASTGGRYDLGPEADILWEKGYTECYDIIEDTKMILSIDEASDGYVPYSNIFRSNGHAYAGIEPFVGGRLRCDWRVDSYFDQDTTEWVEILPKHQND